MIVSAWRRTLAKAMGAAAGAVVGLLATTVIAAPLGLLMWLVTVTAELGLVVVPIVLAIGAAFGAVFGWAEVARRVDPTLLECQVCGYDLRAITTRWCPECGERITAAQRRALRRLEPPQPTGMADHGHPHEGEARN